MNNLQGKKAVVTGGAQGIGYGICHALAAAGSHVTIADVHEARMKEAAEELRKLGFSCDTVPVDVTKEESVQQMFKVIRERQGRVDIFVNCAGAPPNILPVIRLSTTEWNRVLGVNLLGTFICCREAARMMAEQGGGKIVNVASLNAVAPAALSGAYNVAKAGVVSLTQTLAVEMAPFGVNVNAVSPGPTTTEFHDTVMPQRAATLGISREEIVERVRASIPLGRWGKPGDTAKAVLFLASDESEWITGQNLIVAGGLSGVAASPRKEIILGKE